MSVIEHIEQDMQDPKALSELLRVLKPGGLLLISVPIGATHVEQFTSDFSYESNRVTDQQPRFFQRIFDRTTARRYIVESLGPYIDDVCLRTIFRRPSAQSYHAVRASIGDSLSGVLGFTNPLWSLLYNRHCDGLDIDFYSSLRPGPFEWRRVWRSRPLVQKALRLNQTRSTHSCRSTLASRNSARACSSLRYSREHASQDGEPPEAGPRVNGPLRQGRSRCPD